MKQQIRNGVFETNSSSTHSLSIFKTSDWERFMKGEMVIHNYPYTSELIEVSKVDPSLIWNSDDTESDWWDYDYFYYKDLDDVGCYETIEKEVGDCTVMSLYGSSD